MPNRYYLHTRNAIFRVIFVTEWCCSTSRLKVVHYISDKFSERFDPSTVINVESRKHLCVINVGLLQTMSGYGQSTIKRLYF